MRKFGAVAGFVGLASCTLMACGDTAVTSNLQPQVGVSSLVTASVSSSAPVQEAPSSLPPDGPTINWDTPIPDGTTVSDMAEAQRVGELPWTPQLPPFGLDPVKIQVADPNEFRSVALVYHFATGVDFPTDGRVRVLETKADITEQDLLDVVKNPPGPPEDFSDITLSGGQSALLVAESGVARVQFIKDNVQYDVFGPALSPAEAIKLAGKMAAPSG